MIGFTTNTICIMSSTCSSDYRYYRLHPRMACRSSEIWIFLLIHHTLELIIQMYLYLNIWTEFQFGTHFMFDLKLFSMIIVIIARIQFHVIFRLCMLKVLIVNLFNHYCAQDQSGCVLVSYPLKKFHSYQGLTGLYGIVKILWSIYVIIHQKLST